MIKTVEESFSEVENPFAQGASQGVEPQSMHDSGLPWHKLGTDLICGSLPG
jgi:hypothetical protein